MRPIPVQMKHCLVVAFESVIPLQAIYARVLNDNKSVTVWLMVKRNTDEIARGLIDGESTIEALFPNANIEFRVVATQGRSPTEVAEVMNLQKEHKVY
jgi:hypothetical protein